MVYDPALSEVSSQKAPAVELQAQLEKTQGDSVQLRREVLYWKTLARQHETRLKDIESSATWRIFSVFQILPELRHRWKLLLLVGALALLTLPLWPLLVILVCFSAGRDLIWRVLWKVAPLRDLMCFVRQKILGHIGGSHGEVSIVAPLIYYRPTEVESPATGMTGERVCWLLLQQLSPQRRILLQGFGLTRNALMRPDESADLLSLSRAEISILRISAGSHSITVSGSACSQ